jgi:ornithine cyclodeaminase/alanine dehydrogenase-like protein (mu-crystallin family)
MSTDLLVLSGTDVDNIIQEITPSQLIALMARVFTDLASSQSSNKLAGTVTIPHRNVIASLNHRILFMPSRLASVGTAVKIVSVPTATAPAGIKERGLPASTAVLDEQTGEVVAIVNARKLTALRNAASARVIFSLLGAVD